MAGEELKAQLKEDEQRPQTQQSIIDCEVSWAALEGWSPAITFLFEREQASPTTTIQLNQPNQIQLVCFLGFLVFC